jgi:hypothetical protein
MAVLAALVANLLKQPRWRSATTFLVPDNIELSARAILTQAEARFLRSLERAVNGEYLVCPQLPLWTFLEARSTDAGAAAAFTNRINLKRIDFTLVNRATSCVEMAIELDDPSHQRAGRRDRDAFIETVFKQARIPLVRIPTARNYDPQALREQLHLCKPDASGKPFAGAV